MTLKFLKYSWIPVFIAAIIFYLSCLIPANDVPDIDLHFFIPTDKLVHFCMYLGLSGATALYYVYDKKGNVNILKLLIGAIIIPILYGGLIEILQWKYFPPRSGDWFDFLADILGSLASLPFVFYYRNRLLRIEKNQL